MSPLLSKVDFYIFPYSFKELVGAVGLLFKMLNIVGGH